MSADKKNKKHSKKDMGSTHILDLTRIIIKKFRKVTREIGKLSPGQKLMGSLAVAAAGLAYLAARDSSDEAATPTTDSSRAIIVEAEPSLSAPARKHPKRSRFAAE